MRAWKMLLLMGSLTSVALAWNLGCDGDGDASSTEAAEIRALMPSEIVGAISPGQTLGPIAYENPPRYRALRFSGQAGDSVVAIIRCADGDALGFLLDSTFKSIATNDDMNGTTHDARLTATLPTTGTYYIAFRERDFEPATFTVSFGSSATDSHDASTIDSGPYPTDGGSPQNLVISQLYVGGGLQVAGDAASPVPSYRRDYIEIFNPSNQEQALDGLSIQWADATGDLGQPALSVDGGPLVASWLALPSSRIRPGAYLLLAMGGAPEGFGADLPIPLLSVPTNDAGLLSAGWLNLANPSGKVALVRGREPLACGSSGNPCPRTRIVDLVGYGTASDSEGHTAAGIRGLALARRVGGCFDSNDNAADFSYATPTPHTSTSPLHPCH